MILASAGVVVLCDANVLYKILLRDLIMRLGRKGAVAPRWTGRIHEEWMRNLQMRRPAVTRAAAERTRSLMDAGLPGALVSIPAPSRHTLPDPDDRHVLDAAFSAGASVLLTFNLKHFPSAALPASLQAVHPDAFLVACLEQQQAPVLDALRELRSDLKKPPFSPDELLAAMIRAEVPAFAEHLQRFRGQI